VRVTSSNVKLATAKTSVAEENIIVYNNIILNPPKSKKGAKDSTAPNRNSETPLTQYRIHINTDVGGTNPVFRATIQSLTHLSHYISLPHTGGGSTPLAFIALEGNLNLKVQSF
jgi:hypothetical protein